MPTDDKGYPLKSYYTESGMHVLTYEEKQAYDHRTHEIAEGADPDDSLTEGQKDALRDILGL